jgi:hypothetical protein
MLLLLLPGFLGASEQTAALILGTCLTLEEPVTEVDFRSGLFRGRLVDISPAIGGEEDGLQGSRNASLPGAVVVLGAHGDVVSKLIIIDVFPFLFVSRMDYERTVWRGKGKPNNSYRESNSYHSSILSSGDVVE